MHRLLARVIREDDQASGRAPATLLSAIRLLESQLLDEGSAWPQRNWGAELVLQIHALWDSSVRALDDEDLAERLLRLRIWAVPSAHPRD